MKKLRILQVSSADSPGGGERHISDLSKALLVRGHEIHVAVRKSSPLRGMLTGQDVHWHELPLRNAADLASARRLALLIREHRIDTIHGHVARDYPVCGLAARMSDVNLFLTRHHYRQFARSRLYAWAISPVRNLIAVSANVRASLERAFPSLATRVVVIPNWVDLSPVDTVSRELSRERLGIRRQVAVGVIGQLTALKGQDLFIRAAARLNEAGVTDVDFVIVGGSDPREIEYEKGLKSLVRDLALEDTILFSGYVPGFSRFLNAFDLVVAPSENEGFSLVVAEAMAARVAVIASRAGGLAELVEDEITGLLVPVGDLDALSAAVGRLLTDSRLRSRLGNAGRASIERRFERERVIDQIEDLYLAY